MGTELVYANYFTYDKAGNRSELHRLESGVDQWTYYSYDASDELLSETTDGATTYYSYDANGNTTRKDDGAEICYYSYDADNLMVGYQDPSASAYYRYDARPDLRRRVVTEVDGSTTYFTCDNLDCIVEYDGGVSHQRSHVTPFLDGNLALISDGSTYHYTKDGVGSIRELLDTLQVLKNSYDYEAFGSQHGTPTETVTQPFRFTARRWEAHTEQYYHRRRLYDPHAGRFLSRDPLVYYGRETNAYRYGRDNPTRWTDPTGAWCVGVGVAGSVTGMVSPWFIPWPWGAGLSISYASQLFVCTGRPYTWWCDTGAVTFVAGPGVNVSVGLGAVVTFGGGDAPQEGAPSVSVGVGVGVPYGAGGVEVTVDIDIETGWVTINIPRLTWGMTGYIAARLTGSCTGCSPGCLSLFTPAGMAMRLRKLRTCLRMTQMAMASAVASIDGRRASLTEETRWRFNAGRMTVDVIPPEHS